jgi:archaellum biogenesis protein FlaJ (TadC family)
LSEWFYSNEGLIGWLVALSIVSALVSLIILPVILLKLPEDYFAFSNRHRVLWVRQHRLLRMVLLLVLNFIGLVFILAGILMLILPGQGILTIIVGLVLMEFPGKYRVERWLITRPSVLPAINWIRTKAGKAELVLGNEVDY